MAWTYLDFILRNSPVLGCVFLSCFSQCFSSFMFSLQLSLVRAILVSQFFCNSFLSSLFEIYGSNSHPDYQISNSWFTCDNSRSFSCLGFIPVPRFQQRVLPIVLKIKLVEVLMMIAEEDFLKAMWLFLKIKLLVHEMLGTFLKHIRIALKSENQKS